MLWNRGKEKNERALALKGIVTSSNCNSLTNMHHRTFHTLSDPDKIYAKLNEVAVELSKDMTEDGWTGKTVTLKYKLDNFQGERTCTRHLLVRITNITALPVFTRAKSLTRWVSTRQEVLFAVCSIKCIRDKC